MHDVQLAADVDDEGDKQDVRDLQHLRNVSTVQDVRDAVNVPNGRDFCHVLGQQDVLNMRHAPWVGDV